MLLNKQSKGKSYEVFSEEILLLKNISWENSKETITYDIKSEENRIIGASGAKHQIDIHLVSSQNPECHSICECKNHTNPVEKSAACSFVTVVNDIKKKQKNWKVCAAFLSNHGFQKGAVQVLNYYDIVPMDLEDVSRKSKSLSISFSVASPDIEFTNVELEDGSKVDCNNTVFFNYDEGPITLRQSIGKYELLDINNKPIIDLANHIGFFKTGKQKYKNNKHNILLTSKEKMKVKCIEGVVRGCSTYESEKDKLIINSDVKGVLKTQEGNFVYYFKKDGTVEKRHLHPHK